MSANRWVEHFRQLHTRARKNQLDASEQREYQAAREYFARALTAAQGLLGGAAQRRAALRLGHVAHHDRHLATSSPRNLSGRDGRVVATVG